MTSERGGLYADFAPPRVKSCGGGGGAEDRGSPEASRMAVEEGRERAGCEVGSRDSERKSRNVRLQS